MTEIKETRYYTRWFKNLRDREAHVRIHARIRRFAEDDNPGDHRDFGDVSELRIHYGPGYRVYYTKYKGKIILLLCGGDKSTQSKDIETARDMARNLKEGKDDDRY